MTIGLQRAIGREGGGLTHRLLGPVGIAATQFGEAADEGDGIIRRFAAMASFGFALAVAILFVLVRGCRSAEPGIGPPICTGVAAPILVPGAIAAIWVALKNVGTGARRVRSGGRDVAYDRNR